MFFLSSYLQEYVPVKLMQLNVINYNFTQFT